MSERDQPGTLLRYFDAAAPREAGVRTPYGEYAAVVTLGERPGESRSAYKVRRARVTREWPVTVHDARSVGSGLQAFRLEQHGFVFLPAPRPVSDFYDHEVVRRRYAPSLGERVRDVTGATRSLLIGQQVRDERSGRGTSSASYARFVHSDYGPEFEGPLRGMLHARWGLDRETAAGCGLAVVGFWAPIDRPAYRDPLALLDYASVGAEAEMVRYLYHGDLHYRSRRPLAERIPAAAQDAPAIAPSFAAGHRWYFAPDMRPDEGVLFKHYDWRVGSGAPAAWHTSFHDRFHDRSGLPGRRSIEIRLLLTFE